jgi:acyl-CoA thioesterase
MSFASATSVAFGSTDYRGHIDEGWDVVGNANGGYLMAIAARAMTAASGRPHPVTVTGHFLAPGRVGPVTVAPEVLKQGRSFSTVRADLRAEDRTLVSLLGSFGDLPTLEGPVLVDAEPPELPDPDECVRIEPSPAGFPPAMMDKVDLRLHPDDAGFGLGRPSGRPEFRGWFRPLPGEDLDVFTLLLAVDAFPPTIFNADLPVAWTPTVELTAHVRGLPEPGWLRCRFSTRFITGGMLEEDGEVWDESGRLVAQSRQLALMPRTGTT